MKALRNGSSRQCRHISTARTACLKDMRDEMPRNISKISSCCGSAVQHSASKECCHVKDHRFSLRWILARQKAALVDLPVTAAEGRNSAVNVYRTVAALSTQAHCCRAAAVNGLGPFAILAVRRHSQLRPFISPA